VACGSGSPDFTVHSAPGVKLTELWVLRDQRFMRDLPGPKQGSRVLWAARAAAEAGLHGGARRRVHVCAVLGTGAVANGLVRVRNA
jgi:hypothetical protein